MDEIADLSLGALEAGATQKPEEIDWLVRQIEDEEIHTVVEIGTNNGGTLWLWLQLASYVVSVDLPGGDWGGGYNAEDADRFRSWVKPGQTLELVAADSHLRATRTETVKRLGGRRVDLLFVDGDHTYDGVKKDFEMYGPLVRDGGLVVFHDITHHPEFPACQVDRFWGELAADGNCAEFVGEPDTWGGIGVFYL